MKLKYPEIEAKIATIPNRGVTKFVTRICDECIISKSFFEKMRRMKKDENFAKIPSQKKAILVMQKLNKIKI